MILEYFVIGCIQRWKVTHFFYQTGCFFKKVIRLLFCNGVQFKQLNSKSYDNTNKHECVFDVLVYLFMPDKH